MAAAGDHEQYVRKTELFTVLQGYASTLEVQYMIDKSIECFAAKKLESLVQACVDTQRGDPVSATCNSTDTHAGNQQNASEVTNAGTAPTAEWMETLLRAKVEADLAQQLPALVEREMRRQLAAREESRQQRTDHEVAQRRERAETTTTTPPRRQAGSRSPPPEERPPLPPSASPPRAPLSAAGHKEGVPAVAVKLSVKDDDDEEVEDAGPHLDPHGSGTSTSDGAVATNTTRTAASEAARQRARILGAIQDIEHQVNTLQRQVNELSHQGRTSHQRMARFWSAVAPVGWTRLTSGCAATPASASTAAPPDATASSAAQAALTASAATTTQSGYGPFYAALLEALDAGEVEPVRELVSETVAAWQRVHVEAGDEPVRHPSPLTVGDHKDPSQSPSGPRPLTVAASPAPASANESVDSGAGGSSSAYLGTSSWGSRGAHPQLPVLPMYTRHTAPAMRMEPLTPSAGSAPQLGVDAVDVPGGLLPSSLGLRGGGVRVLSLAPGQAAERSGLLPGDVLLQVRQTPVETCAQLRTALRGVQPQDVVPVEVYRHSAQALLAMSLLF